MTTQEPVMLKYVAVFVLSLSLFVQPARSQQPQLTSVNQVQTQKMAAEREASNDRTPDNQRERMERDQIAHMIAERQLQLRRDTEKLVALTAELKQNVDKTGVNILSMDVIKKAQEIQKLAKSVQDKMRNAY
jgi:hypothetical protein